MNCLSRVFILLCGAFCLMPAQVSASDIEVKEKQDSVTQLSEIAVIAKAKQKNDLRLEPLSATVIKLGDIERKQIVGLSDLSYQTPNLYIPDYGSKMTSSIYVRGLGSRIDNPAVGLYVDNVPLLNKNGYDFDMWDIMRMEVLRGPQSTLYGRNTVGGIINIYTLSPKVYQGLRLSGSYSTGNSYNIKGSYYGRITKKLAFSLGGNYFSSDGFFKNEFDGSECDWIKGGTGRFRLVYSPNSKWTIDNSLNFSLVEQGGYGYRLYDSSTGTVNPVNYNDKSGYDRVTVSNGLSVNYNADNYVFSSVTSWQYLDDCMILDQDFTPKDMFTLKQAQHEHTVTQDFVFKSKEGRRYQWLTGATFFYKGMDLDAPVVFKQDGINELILDNVNSMFQHMPAPMNTANLAFKQPELNLNSAFGMPVTGAAIYHQSGYTIGKFTFTAGLRFDFENSKISYSSDALVDYIYTMKIQMSPMMPPREIKVEKSVETLLEGKLSQNYFEVLPKFALQYSLGKKGNLYASVTRGFKAGGYNTQMFSDILQNQLKSDLMKDLMSSAGGSMGSGGSMGGNSSGSANYTVEDIITYKPEYSWNYEVGAHLNLLGGGLKADAALFYIDCKDQQLTVFPDGTTTGRMMTNAGKTRSLGLELALDAKVTGGLNLNCSYGYTKAKFTEYDNGIVDYAGKYVPYVPLNTLSANLSYTLYNIGGLLDMLSFRIGYNGIGKIYWNEENSVCENFYSLMNASIYAHKGILSLELWSKNLTNTNYNTFYFVSVGNAFFSQGRPAEFGVTLSLHL